MLMVQLNNLELAVNIAKRGNLPGAENLVIIISKLYFFHKLISEPSQIMRIEKYEVMRLAVTLNLLKGIHNSSTDGTFLVLDNIATV